MGAAPPRSPAVGLNGAALVRSLLRSRWAAQLPWIGLAAACVFPLFYVRYAPIQDLPQHLAAVRVLHDFHDPALRFARYFELDLWRTQYLAYYVAADLLAYLTGVELACKLLIAGSLVGTPYALRSLLEALGKDGRLALLAFPLAYNAHLVLGFLNFLAAIPLALYGLALAVRQRRASSRTRALALAAIAFVCFYTHVVPFALLALGVGLVGLSRSPPQMARAYAPLAPVAIALLIWLRASPAGQATAAAARGAESGPLAQYQPARDALREMPRWLTDVLHDGSGLRVLHAWGALIALACALGLAEWLRARVRAARAGSAVQPAAEAPDALARGMALRLSLLAPLCAALYFVLPTGYDWIWPIAPRFPLLAALFAIVALPRFTRLRNVVAALAIALAAASFHFSGRAFAAFDREEVGDFDQALAQIPAGQRVVGLIFQRGSRQVAFSPFIHYVAYYQARKGGAVMFSFADFPQSPFRFREDARPPRVPPRWEWMPERVRPARDLAFFDYALVRGGPGAIARRNSGFVNIHRGGRWSVFRRAAGGILEPAR